VAALVNPVITRVGFPVMSRVKDDRDQLKSIYLQTLRLTASVNFPMYVALGLFANEIVGLLYGPRWHPAAQYLRVLAAWGLVRSVGNPVGSLLYAVGRARLAFWWNVALLVVSPPILWAAASVAGLMGLAWGLLGLNLMIVVPMWRLLLNPACGVRFDEYLSAITAPLLIAGASGFAAWIATVGIHGSIARLAIGGGVGGIVYVGLSYLYNRAWTDAMVHLFDTRKTS
jgi:O-antigen/teichoic acid export membrane protein